MAKNKKLLIRQLLVITTFALSQACVESSSEDGVLKTEKYQVPRKAKIDKKMKEVQGQVEEKMTFKFYRLRNFLSNNLKVKDYKTALGVREALNLDDLKISYSDKTTNEDYSYNSINNEFKFNYSSIKLIHDVFSKNSDNFLDFIVGLPMFIELDGISDNSPTELRELKKKHGDNAFNFNQCFFNPGYNEFMNKDLFNILSKYFYLGYYLGHKDGANLDTEKGDTDGILAYFQNKKEENKKNQLPLQSQHAMSFGYHLAKHKSFVKFNAEELKVVFRKILLLCFRELKEETIDYVSLIQSNTFGLSNGSYFLNSATENCSKHVQELSNEINAFHHFWNIKEEISNDRVVIDYDGIFTGNEISKCAKSTKFNETYYIYNFDKITDYLNTDHKVLLLRDVARKYISVEVNKEKDLVEKALGDKLSQERFYEKGTSILDIRYDNKQVDEFMEADFVLGFYSRHRHGKALKIEALENCDYKLWNSPSTIKLFKFKKNKFNTRKVLSSNEDVKARFELRGEVRKRFFKLGTQYAEKSKFRSLKSNSFAKLHKSFCKYYREHLLFPLINKIDM